MIIYDDYESLKERIDSFYKVALIIDETCEELLNHPKWSRLNALVGDLSRFVLPLGEAAKSFNVLEQCLDFLCENNLSRKDCVLNIGGGITSDLGGLAAALYKRGCAHINIPTTLLAAADASIGGKTGINNSYGKNLIGVFKEPQDVFIFDDLLTTLPAEQLACGWAEMIKMIACFNVQNYERINELSQQEALKIAINIKQKVVEQDLHESNLRMLLNYGHTFAHAIEHENNYRILHGQAVAVGMLMADDLARFLGMLHEKKLILESALKLKGCQTNYKIKNLDEFISCMQKDKKNSLDKITFILRSDEGAQICSDVAINSVRKVLEGWAY